MLTVNTQLLIKQDNKISVWLSYNICNNPAEKQYLQGGSNMTGTDLYKRTHKSVPVIFEPPCIN